MSLFRRRKEETLNEQLLREAGLDPAQLLGDSTAVTEAPPEPPLLESTRRRTAADGLSLDPRQWDGAVTVRATELAGDEIKFTTIPDGDLIVSEESGDADLSPLADAMERHVAPPYRAVAARQDGDLWAVCARRIQVAQIPFPTGDKLELSWNGEDGELRVDGEVSDAEIPRELEEIGEAAGTSYYVGAERIDGDLWEVKATAF